MGAIYSTMTYSDATVRVAKIEKATHEIRGSVDGKKYGTSGDKRHYSKFKDQDLINQGYTEAIATCGGLFYPYDGANYAEGLEKSMGVNNQDIYMSCVADFNEVMAVGYPYSGGVVFAKQKDIIANLGSYYGASTFAFGIMKDGVKAEWGKTEHKSQYNCISGRAILGQNDKYVFMLDVEGTTGKSGLKGYQLYGLCNSLGMKDAGCWDGGGSVFFRVNGTVKDSTPREVKHANLLYVKEKKVAKPTNNTSGGSMTVKIVGGSYGVNKSKVATRATATGKYSTSYPVYVGDEIKITKIQSVGENYCGYMADGRLPGRWLLLDPQCMTVTSVDMKFKIAKGAYGTNKQKVATRPTVLGKYDTGRPVQVGDTFTVDKITSQGNYYIGHMKDGKQIGRWIQLDPSDIVQV